MNAHLKKLGLVLMILVLVSSASITVLAQDDDDPLVVTWWSEPSNLDYHSFGTDGDGDLRLALGTTLIRRAQVEGPYENTTIAVAGRVRSGTS